MSEFELSTKFKRKAAYLRKYPFYVLSEAIKQEQKWRGFAFPQLTFIYLYNKAKSIRNKLNFLACKYNKHYNYIIESVSKYIYYTYIYIYNVYVYVVQSCSLYKYKTFMEYESKRCL